MSEVLTIAKEESADEARTDSRESAQKRKLALVSSLLTAITTIGVAFIAIVPQLRSGDARQVEKLHQEINVLKEKATSPGAAATSTKKLDVIGTVVTKSGKPFPAGVEVYLLPDGNDTLVAKTTVQGRFTFKGVPDGDYKALVRMPGDGLGKSVIVSFDKKADQVPLDNLSGTVSYGIAP